MEKIIMRRGSQANYCILFWQVVICIGGGLLLNACNGNSGKNQAVNYNGELVVVVQTKSSLAHGWGYVYTCAVEKVLKGELLENAFSLHIKVSDYDSLVQLGMAAFMEPQSNRTIIMEFESIENNQSYVNGENAFIDQKKQTWRLIELNQFSEKGMNRRIQLDKK